MRCVEDGQTLKRGNSRSRPGSAGAAAACAVVEIDARTQRCWQGGRTVAGRAGAPLALRTDRRPGGSGAPLTNALSEAARARITAIANRPQAADTPPAQIAPMAPDEERSTSRKTSFDQVLRARPNVAPVASPAAAALGVRTT